ncbi:NADH-quinone oxidoreductase subunit C [Niallia oryzisoli]|uniref:NADH-quinone oxidoreductase subunit C n=1 Tax=Niallia oryzisoli TaxID=1737571 RepID=UPI003736031B
MSGEKDIEQLKKEAAAKAKAAAAAKAKAAAQAKLKAEEQAESLKETEASAPADDLAKQKAAAAAKAKAAALAKAKAKEQAGESSGSDDDEAKAKAKAAAVAKAKAAAAAKAKAAAGGGDAGDEKAKAIAAAKAKAAAAAAAKAKAAGGGDSEPAEEVEMAKPSPNQPYLDKYVKVIEEHIGKEAIEESYINKLAKDMPTLILRKEYYYKVTEYLKYNEQLSFDYLSELHGTDFQTHMEVYVSLYSYKNSQPIAIKVKLDRDQPEIESLVPLWAGANWPECEAYDLLGIKFLGHPDLHRIMLGEEWIGHPLRKDYEPYDVEV